VSSAGHDTPDNVASRAPAGAGVAWITQAVPSSASASGTRMPARSFVAPTAVQDEAEGHATEAREPLGTGGLMVGTSDHPSPSA